MDITQITYADARGKGVDVKAGIADAVQQANGSLFSEFMTSGNSAKDVSAKNTAYRKDTAAAADQKDAGAYDRYRYKDNAIDQAQETTVSDKVTELAEETEQLTSDVVQSVSEAFDVDEETVENAMEILGLTALDLLNPQNLAELAKTITGTTDDTEILLSDDFRQAFSDVSELLDTFSTENGIEPSKFAEFAAAYSQMQDAVEQPDISREQPDTEAVAETQVDEAGTQPGADVPHAERELETAVQPEEPFTRQPEESTTTTERPAEQPVGEQASQQAQPMDAMKQTEPETEKTAESATQQTVPETEQTTEPVVQQTMSEQDAEQTAAQTAQQQQREVVVEDRRPAKQEESHPKTEPEEATAPEENEEPVELPEGAGQSGKNGSFASGKHESQDFSQHLAGSVNEQAAQFAGVAEAESTAEVPEYTTIDTQDIIEQIVEQTKVILDTESTTIEMQLNPENLGKIFLNISSKEGSVNAQLYAQNEAVKAALEAQIATLTENLNQAGVKVNAIEVSVATHEFERNLEQNAKGDEEQGERREERRFARRSLRMDSLDELSGLMTEEEALVAQMMRDNGNSVDFTA